MLGTEKTVEHFHNALKMLDETGPTEDWKVVRLCVNAMLRNSLAKLEYDDWHGKSTSDEDRANIKEAIELRRQVYRKLKKIKEGGSPPVLQTLTSNP